MDKMNSDNNLNASTSQESGIKSLQVVKRAIATNEKYSYLEHTHRNLEKAINEFDLQGSHILAEDWIKEAENAYRLLHPLELQPEIQREITTVMLSQMIEYISGKNEAKNEAPITTRQGQALYLLSNANKDNTAEISGNLKANLASAKEGIDRKKSCMQELKERRTAFKEHHEQSEHQYHVRLEEYNGLGGRFQVEVDERNEEHKVKIARMNVKRKNHDAKMEELDRELADYEKMINEKKAQETEALQLKESELKKELQESAKNLSDRQEGTRGNVENNLIEAELALTESRRTLVNNTIGYILFRIIL